MSAALLCSEIYHDFPTEQLLFLDRISSFYLATPASSNSFNPALSLSFASVLEYANDFFPQHQ